MLGNPYFSQVQELRGACSNRMFDPMEAGLACGSMALFLSFSEKCCTVCNIFLKKHGIFHSAGGESGRLSRQTHGWFSWHSPPLEQSPSRIGTACGRAEARPYHNMSTPEMLLTSP
jgi:hypothetical protein